MYEIEFDAVDLLAVSHIWGLVTLCTSAPWVESFAFARMR